ncbi:hypothetical protein FN846DRAFT_1024148 [Sphaerosporella brunnea]|uniref:LRAT domain-containing protein n=1 Tax=Sphaerosporella brunnea TaxID=1250544 RepID=A0A5J5EL93_9PEZI|nr:hypothetical protein FN846DRAFT_1024148 [Sphaerosporella brunnea]
MTRAIRTFARKLSGKRLDHWAVALNDPIDAIFEITAPPAGVLNLVETTDKAAIMRKIATYWEFDDLKLTTALPNAEIHAIAQKLTVCTAKDYIDKHPNYNLLTNNCQHFVKALVKGIRDTGRGANDEDTEKAIDALRSETEPPSLDLLATE